MPFFAALGSTVLTLLLAASATAQPVTVTFTDSQGRTLVYGYSPESLLNSGQQPGLLLYFGERTSMPQEEYITYVVFSQRPLQRYETIQETAKEHGLVLVALAPSGEDELGNRQWYDKDILLVHELLQTELPSRFSFDPDRIVFWGESETTCFLHEFIAAHGTGYGGGLYARCGCLDSFPQQEVPSSFSKRFKVVIQAATGDYRYENAILAYIYYRFRLGLDTFGDLSQPGGICRTGAVSAEDAVGWILGTRSLADTGVDSELDLPLQLTNSRTALAEPTAADCSDYDQVAILGQTRGDGELLWVADSEDDRADASTQNARVVNRIERVKGTEDQFLRRDFLMALAVDVAGNLYVADRENHRVQRIDPAGVISTIAGTGEAGFNGDGGPATEARLRLPYGVAVDAAGNLYVADRENHRVRRIDPAGVISTIAGTGEAGFSGDGGLAIEARLWFPSRLAVDAASNLYVADTGNHRVRRIDPAGVISTIAGTGEVGFSGDGGPATEARLNLSEYPGGVVVDVAGNLYVADTGNHRVRRIDPAGVISTIAGTGEAGFSGDGGPASEARLNRPFGLAVDEAGNLFVADFENHRVRRINPAGVITTIAGTGDSWFVGDPVPASGAAIGSPDGIAVDAAGKLYVATYGGIGRISASLLIVPLGQSGETVHLDLSDNGLVTRRGEPLFVGAHVVGGDGVRYSLSQDLNGAIAARRVPTLRVSTSTTEPGVGVIATIAGTGAESRRWYEAGDGGPATEADLDAPTAVVVDQAGNLYVADEENHTVRRIDSAGVITHIAGTGQFGYSGDGGPATQARLNYPKALAVDQAGNLYVADEWNHVVRRIDTDGVITTIAGTGEEGFSGDGGPATQAHLNAPNGLAVDSAGNLYVADQTNQRVRRIDTAGVITTIAGTPPRGHDYVLGDGSPATETAFPNPVAVAADQVGNIYVANTDSIVARIDTAGVMSFVADLGEWSDSGGGSPAVRPRTTSSGLVVNGAGNLYVLDVANHRVGRIDATGGIITMAGTGEKGFSGDGGPATEAHFDHPRGLGSDAAGNLYVADYLNRRVRLVSITPYQESVPLGSSGLTVLPSVSEEGGVTLYGKPVLDGTWLAACNGNTYALSRAAEGDLRATYVSERQVIELGNQQAIILATDESGVWRIGDDIVRAGHRHVHAGREYILDRLDGRWRLASYAMRTVAGHTEVADGILATAATIYAPTAVAADSAGNLYVADRENNRIRRIDIAGMIATFAGTGERGYEGDGGTATEAMLDRPSGVALDSAGNVYVADTGNHCVRRIDLTGTIETLAGTGNRGYGGDGGPAAAAWLDNPMAVAADMAGNVYVADSGNHRIRRIDMAGGIETLAGTGERGYGGDGGPASEASLDGPSGVAVDRNGNVYVADYLNRRVRRIDSAGMVSTFAGTGEAGHGGDGGQAAGALLDGPSGVAVDTNGNVYVADYLNRRVRRIDTVGVISTFAGTGETGYGGDGGRAAEAALVGPFGVTADAAGNVYVADLLNHRIRRIDTSGEIVTVVGTGDPFHRGDGGFASQAQFSHRLDEVALDTNGNVYVADPYDHTVRRIDVTEMIATVVGTGTAGYGGDGGSAAGAQLNGPSGVAADAAGNLYVADTENHRLRRIDAAGMITTLAGTGEAGYSGEGHPATASQLNLPDRVAVDAANNAYVLDTGNQRVRIIGTTGQMRTVAGNGISERLELQFLAKHFQDSDAVRVPLFGATNLAVDSGADDGATLHLRFGDHAMANLFWSVSLDSGRIRVFDRPLDGVTSRALAIDREGNLYYADRNGIYKKGRNGSVSLILEPSEYGISVGGMAVDESGRIWFTDPEHRRVRVLEPVAQLK